MIRCSSLPADVLELSSLARDALSGRCRVRGLEVPRRSADLARPSARFDAHERAALAQTLERRLAPLEPHVAVLDAVRSLRDEHACVVITGQQPGFLCAPLYSLYKALQAVRCAQLLRERWNVPVVALFWNHADDHDVAEVHHTYLQNQNLDLQKVALAGLSSGRQPLSRIVIDEDAQHLSAIRALLAQSLAGKPDAARALELFMPRSGETFAGAFTRGMTQLCGALGLVLLEPDWIRDDIADRLAAIVSNDPASALARGTEQVRAAGYDVAIDPANAALLFALDRRGERAQRRALRAGGDGFRYDGEDGSRSASELAAEIVQDRSLWSPGALLRPIVQDLCLPVAAYIGGFGELAYHAQLLELRARMSAPITPFLPRVSCTLVDPECRAALARLGLDVGDVLRARGTFADDATNDAPAVIGALRAVGERASRDLLALESELVALDRTLQSPLKHGADQLRALVDKLVDKAERVHQNHSGKGKRHERRVVNLLFPRGMAQERVLGPLQFVAAFGVEWVRELCDELDPFSSEHLVVDLGAERATGAIA